MRFIHTADLHLGAAPDRDRPWGPARADAVRADLAALAERYPDLVSVSSIGRSVEGREIPPPPPLAERLDAAVGQIESLAEQRGEHAACMEARHQLPWYLHGVPHSSVYRQELVRVETLEDIRRTVRGAKRDLT